MKSQFPMVLSLSEERDEIDSEFLSNNLWLSKHSTNFEKKFNFTQNIEHLILCKIDMKLFQLFIS